MIAKQADIIAAFSIEVLQGTPRAFDYDIHANRPHPGQQLVASRLRALLDSNVHPSEIRSKTKKETRQVDQQSSSILQPIIGIVGVSRTHIPCVVSPRSALALAHP